MYKYLVSYGFNQNQYSEYTKKYYEVWGTGRTILVTDIVIDSLEAIKKTEEKLMDLLKNELEDVLSVVLYSFSLLEGE